jgi:hypothetical protein
MIGLVLAYTILAGGIIAAAYAYAPPTVGKWEEFARLGTLGFAALSAITAPVTSLFIAYRQAKLQRQIESLRTDLQTQVEFFKITVPQGRSAYLQLYGAAFRYYHVLAPLETGNWDIRRIREAENQMIEVGPQAPFLPVDDHRRLWLRFWQAARRTAEKANRLGDSQSRRNLWTENVRTLGGLLRQFERAMVNELQSPPTNRLTQPNGNRFLTRNADFIRVIGATFLLSLFPVFLFFLFYTTKPSIYRLRFPLMFNDDTILCNLTIPGSGSPLLIGPTARKLRSDVISSSEHGTYCRFFV